MSRIESTIAEEVAGRLRKEIQSGAIKPGEFLRQNIVAERMGVSSTPVREAFSILEREGMVRREPRRGVVVFEPNIDDLFNCYEIREALEVLAARKAAKRLTRKDIDWLGNLVEKMAVSTDLSEYMDMNRSFHERIERAAGCDRLFDLIASQRAAATTYLAFLGLNLQDPDETTEEHRMIVEALATGVPNVAGNAMSRHLRARAEALSDRLSRLNCLNDVA